ncbi:MAG TPA: EamA family transporter [Vicinamibacterales bacterium]|nr:EamA family transporter [Vicinamibacterales bacterium]
MRIRLVAVWWIACLLWSSTFLFIRIGVAEIRPFTLAWVRLAMALAILVPIARVRGDLRTLRSVDVRRVAGAGLLLLGVNYALLFWGAQFIPSGLVAILQSATPLLALAFACATGQERFTFLKLLTLALGIVGVAVIFGSEALSSGRTAMTGVAAVFGSSICVASAYVWMKGYGNRIPPIALTTIQSGAAALPLLCIALVADGIPTPLHWSAAAWGAVAYLAVAASVVAFWLNYWLLARMDASAMLMMGIAEVPIAVLLGAAFLHERLPAGTFLGGMCVLVAVVSRLMEVGSRLNLVRPGSDSV